MTLKEQFNDLKEQLMNIVPEGKVTVTMPSESTGEFMDLAIHVNKNLVKPFTDSAKQNYYYFQVEIKKNLILIVKSPEKKLK